MKKLTILKGEGMNQHTLYGNFQDVQIIEEYQELKVKSKSILKHEKPDGLFSNEHKGLEVSQGNWVMGKQMEYNPFSQKITAILD